MQSYIITRGSPAISWGHNVDLSYNPKLFKDDDEVNYKLASNHLNEHLEYYGNTLVVNLIEKEKHYQAPIGQKWNTSVDKISNETKTNNSNILDNLWFDFHRECSKKKGGWKQL